MGCDCINSIKYASARILSYSQAENLQVFAYSSSSSASSLTTLKNLNWYTPLLVLTTLNQSRSCCFLRNFFVLLSRIPLVMIHLCASQQ